MDSNGRMIHDVITLVRHGLLETAKKFEESDGRFGTVDFFGSLVKELGSLDKVVALIVLESNADWAYRFAVVSGDKLTTRQKDALVAIVAETHEAWYAERFACDTRGKLTAKQLGMLVAVVVEAKNCDAARFFICELRAKRRLAKRHIDALISVVVEEDKTAVYVGALLSECSFLTEKQKKFLKKACANTKAA